MKKIRFGILFILLLTFFVFSASAKTHKVDVLPNDIIEYTLEEEDKLSAEFIIEETTGLYNVKILSLSTSGNFAPKISIKVFEDNNEIYSFITDKKRDLEGTEPESYGFMTGLIEGEYKVEIENLTKFSDVTFKIETTFTEEENIESFGNINFENASELKVGSKHFGSVTMSGETDFWKFEMPYDGVAYIQMYTPKAKFFTLYDEKKNAIGTVGIEIEEADKVYELRSGLAAGTYFITARQDEDYSDSLYTLKVLTSKGDGFEKEFNNDKNSAMKIESGKEYQGNLFGIHDTDIFTFTLPEKSDVTIDFADTIISKDKHYKITLSGENFTAEYEGGRVKETISLEKGTYYFTVNNLEKDDYTSMIYKLKIESGSIFSNEDSAEKPVEPDSIPEKSVEQFSDVTEDKWYYDEILEAKELGLINGVGDNLFKPEENVSVAEVLVMAVRIKNSIGGANTEITNSPVGNWYNSYITFSVNSGIIRMDDFDNFDRNATREEVAYIFANILGNIQTNENIVISDLDENTKYSDSIKKLYSAGILEGDGNGKFRPDDSITRSEAAAILLRVHKNS